jgi:hypothetical protein
MATNSLDVISLTSSDAKYQFGRVIQVEIFNYELGKKVTIPNNFHISFDFFKTTDEVKQASTGKVIVKNLSDETFENVKTIHACQMILKAGYQDNVKILFFADIIGCKKVVNGNDIDVVFTVSANYFEYKLNYGMKISHNNDYTIATVLGSLMGVINDRNSVATGKKQNYSMIIRSPSSYSDTDTQKLNEYISTAKFTGSFSYSGSLEKIMKDLNDEFGFTFSKDDTRESYIVTLKETHENLYLSKIYSNYPKMSSKSTVSVPSPIYDARDSTTITTLSFDTGLLGSPHVDYKLFTVPENYKGLSTDETTLKSQMALDKRATANEKKAEKATAKPLDKQKIGKKRIRKTYINCLAQLNPDIRPQSIIRIESSDEMYNNIYRVRNATYKGDNQTGAFQMELYLEDTNGAFDTVATEEDVRNYSNFGSDDNIAGSLGSDNSSNEEDLNSSNTGDDNDVTVESIE